MRKTLCLFLFFLTKISVFAINQNFDSTHIGEKVIVNDDRVRIRNNDTLESDCLSILQKGTVATIEQIGNEDVIDSIKNKWVYIRVDNLISGWIWGKYLSLPSDEVFERCRYIVLNSFEYEDYQFFKTIGISKLSEILKFFTSDQLNKISKVHIDLSQNIDFENISLFTKLDYLYIKNAKSLDTQYIPKNISRLILINGSVTTLDLGCFTNLEGVILYSCQELNKIIYPNQIDFIGFYDYSRWYEEIGFLPYSIRELYLCYNNISNFDFIQKLIKYPNLEGICLAGNPIPEEQRLRYYDNFGIFYTDEY